MVDFPTNTWIVLGVIASIAVITILHTIASVVRSEVRVFDLTHEVDRLRRAYAKKLRDAETGGVGEVDIVDDDEEVVFAEVVEEPDEAPAAPPQEPAPADEAPAAAA